LAAVVEPLSYGIITNVNEIRNRESPSLQLLIPVNDSSFRPSKFNRILYVCFFREITNGVYKYSTPDKTQCSKLHVERGSLFLQIALPKLRPNTEGTRGSAIFHRNLDLKNLFNRIITLV
jgi:hypothetical protein